MSIDHVINTIRTKIKEKYNFHTDAEINAFLLGMTEQAEDSQEAIEKRDKMLKDTVAELVDAKRLLKLAVSDFSDMYSHIYDCDGWCDSCPIHGNRDTCDKWRLADEALKLIGEDE